MVKGKRKAKAARPRVNRLLRFAGTPTDAEIDEVIDLWARMMVRAITSDHFLDTVRRLQQLGETLARVSSTFGDA